MDKIQENSKINILKAWHAVEFFQPYDLPQNERSINITHDELERCGNKLLPWFNPVQKQAAGIRIQQKCTYILHLAIFLKEEADLRESEGADEKEEAFDTRGRTCFAKITLDHYGTPDLESFSVSTLPWAIGRLKNGTIDKISYSEFQSSCSLLHEELQRIWISLNCYPRNSQRKVMCSLALRKLIKSLYQWSGFLPRQNVFAFQLDWKASSPKTEPSQQACETRKGEVAKFNIDGSGPEEGGVQEPVLPILNSFFIRDMEWAINSLSSNGEGNKCLNQYLYPQSKKNPDLYTQRGLELIARAVRPSEVPLGRWPSGSGRNMSLMQQFAINKAIQELEGGGMLSINGPPGTGKTTLLKEMVAHNIVQRAAVLSAYSSVSDTYDCRGYLKDDLRGFSMVVASTNNAAVENVSKEFPRVESLGEDFKDIDYFKPVANQLAATENPDPKKENPDLYLPLADKDQCWGTVVATLGSKINRGKFIGRFFYNNQHEKNSLEEKFRSKECNFLNFWGWCRCVKGGSSEYLFSEAKERFLEKQVEIDSCLTKVDQIRGILDKITSKMDLYFIKDFIDKSLDYIYKYKEVGGPLRRLRRRIDLVSSKLSFQILSYEDFQNNKPGVFKYLFFGRLFDCYLIKLMRSELVVKRLKNRLSVLYELEEDLESLDGLLEEFPGITLIDCRKKIGSPEVQRNAPWQSPILNKLRSELFVLALKLHESWAYNYCVNQSVFRNNIFQIGHLINGVNDVQDCGELWDLFFMIVPVVSTTFASFSGMFRGVKEDAIGWLMIDEAGQATPQAAVGGILRAKRVLAIGDPLQVKPVIPMFKKVVDSICENRLGGFAKLWNPRMHSVQQISDRANPYGCNIEVSNKNVWIGIPLWVHRRCINPMFGLANKLAYNNRMIHGSNIEEIEPRPLKNGRKNVWINSIGRCKGKHFKEELVRDTKRLVHEIIKSGHDISSVYIISPFKEVSSALKRRLSYPKLKDKIGTIHTFQGKENDIVILVLGCCPDKSGGAFWASLEPNILNVALTRAKKNFFVVGDAEVWANRPYFRDVFLALDFVGEDEWLGKKELAKY